jgi:hypothetical protein
MTDPITPRTHPNLPASTPAAPIMATVHGTPGNDRPNRYEPPRLTVLGTLAHLTHGGSVGPSDGAGFAGATGSI